jgi:hypothetical protein
MKNTKITNRDSLSDEVQVNLNVLCTLMLDRVGEHVDDADVIIIYQHSSVKGGGAWSSCRSWRNQEALATALAIARYLASALDLEMVF